MTNKIDMARSGRGFVWAASDGDNTWAGTSAQVAKKTLQGCIDAVNSLIPTPPDGGLALISNIEDDFITTPVVLPAATTLDVIGVAISGSSAGPMLTLGGDRQTVEISNVSNAGTGSTVDITDLENVDLRAQIINSLGGGAGVDISGDNDNLFLKISQMRVNGGGSAIKIRGTSASPYDINLDSVSLESSGDSLIDYNPNSNADVCTLNVTSVVNGVAGTCIFAIDGGIIDITSQAMTADKLAIVNNDSRFGLDANEVFGDLEVNNTAIAILKSTGLMVGDLTLSDTATCYLDCSNFVGDIAVPTGTTLEVIIKNHSGNITDKSGTINGIINGVRYGNWIINTNLVLFGASTDNQEPVDVDTPLQIEYGPAQGSGSSQVQLSVDGDITFNETGVYDITGTYRVGRVGSAGGVANIFIRILQDGLQVGNPTSTLVTSPSIVVPQQFTTSGKFTEGTVISMEVALDGSGPDEGGLYTDESSVTLDWGTASSATIRVYKLE